MSHLPVPHVHGPPVSINLPGSNNGSNIEYINGVSPLDLSQCCLLDAGMLHVNNILGYEFACQVQCYIDDYFNKAYAGELFGKAGKAEDNYLKMSNIYLLNRYLIDTVFQEIINARICDYIKENYTTPGATISGCVFTYLIGLNILQTIIIQNFNPISTGGSIRVTYGAGGGYNFTAVPDPSTSHVWDVDGEISTGTISAAHLYLTLGFKPVTLTTTYGGFSVKNLNYSEIIDPHTAEEIAVWISYSSAPTTTGIVSLKVLDVLNPLYTLVSYSWDMGDGTILIGTNISHQYSTNGTYKVKCTMTVSELSGLEQPYCEIQHTIKSCVDSGNVNLDSDSDFTCPDMSDIGSTFNLDCIKEKYKCIGVDVDKILENLRYIIEIKGIGCMMISSGSKDVVIPNENTIISCETASLFKIK